MSGGWFRSRTVRVGAALVLLLVVGTLALPFVIPVDQYRPLFVWAIESGTGRTVEIDALKLATVPNVRIQIVGFRMKNPAGFPAGDALSASSVDVGIALQSLLSRRLVITYVAPADLHVNILRDASGRTNFAAPVPSKSEAAKTAARGPGPAPFITLDRIGDMTLTQAAVSFADVVGNALPKASFTLSVVHGRIDAIDPQATNWAKQLHVVADLRDAHLAAALFAKPVVFRSGELTFQNGAARATFAAASGSVDVSGTAAFARLAPLSMTFSIAAPELDLATLAQLINVGAEQHGGPAGPNRLIAHGTLTTGKLTYAPLVATQLKGQLAVYTRAVHLDACTFSAYGGTVAGNMALEGAAGAPATISLRAHGLNVRSTFAALGFEAANVSGSLDAAFGIAVRLAADPAQSTTASGTFTVRNGSFPGLDVKSTLAQVARLASLNVPSGETHFQSFGGDLRIARERGYSNHLTLLASGIDGTGSGSFGFDQTLAYSGTAVLDALAPNGASASSSVLAAVQQMASGAVQRVLGAARVRVPFALHGTFDHPQFALAGTPQFVTAGGSSPQSAPALPAAAQEILKLIPGL